MILFQTELKLNVYIYLKLVNVRYFLIYLIYFIKVLGLEDTLHKIDETPLKEVKIIDDNLINQRQSSSTSWTPLDSTKLLRSSGKNNKLSSE